MWALQFQDNLPVLPIPLRAPDNDITLDLGLALRTIYERAAYDLSINYREPPPPPTLSPEAQGWWQQRFYKNRSKIDTHSADHASRAWGDMRSILIAI